MSSPREKAKDLIRLAADDRTPEHERMSAAVKAVALIAQHNLLDDPFGGVVDSLRGEKAHTTVKAAVKIYDIFKDPDIVDAFRTIRDTAREARSSRTRRRAR